MEAILELFSSVRGEDILGEDMDLSVIVEIVTTVIDYLKTIFSSLNV